MNRFKELKLVEVAPGFQKNSGKNLSYGWNFFTQHGLSGFLLTTCSPGFVLEEAMLYMVSDCCGAEFVPGPGNLCHRCKNTGFFTHRGEPVKQKVTRSSSFYTGEQESAESEKIAGATFSNWLSAFMGDELEAGVESILLANELMEEVVPHVLDLGNML